MKNIKRYAIDCSPLWMLKSRKKLIEILSLKAYSELRDIEINSHKHYNQFQLISKKGKIRDIKTPIGIMKNVHQKISKLMGRIELPQYLMSKKGSSYKAGAEIHKNNDYCFTTDISNFFPNCIRERLAYSFKEHFKMAGDIAFLLSKLLTFKGRVTQGSHASNLISFWSNYSMFENINNFCSEKRYLFTLFVDDVTISSKVKIEQDDINYILGLLRRNGFKTKSSKTKYFKGDQVKHITGLAVFKGEVFLEKSKKKFFFKNLNKKRTSNEQSLKGMYHNCRYIEPEFAPTLQKRFKKR